MIEGVIRRRHLLIGMAALPLVAGCTGMGGMASMDEAIRRLLMLSTQRAFARLAAQDGFFGDAVLRIGVPERLASNQAGGVLQRLLRTPVVQGQLLRLVNDAAWDAAERTTPILYDSIRRMSFGDAIGIVRGGPQAATNYLEWSVGDRIVDALFPEVGGALRELDGGVLGQLLGAATGVDFTGIQRDVSGSAARAIWSAIGREEAGIRADPRSTGDPVLESVFGLIR